MALDYKDFLKPKQPVVLPYFGGTRVDTADRRLRVEATDEAENLAPGWWRFRIDGRRAVPLEPAEPATLSALPTLRGHVVSGWVVVDARTPLRIALPGPDEPAPLSRVACRTWHSGDLIFDTVEFEDDAELAARDALEHRRPLGNAKGVVPTLRVAFGIAVGLDVARELDVAISPRELMPHAVSIADGGRAVASGMFAMIVERRRREAEELQRRRDESRRNERLLNSAYSARQLHRDPKQNPVRRADGVLEKAGARMLSARRLADGEQLDVTYEVDGTRIMSLVDAMTFQVLDPGLCLDNEHDVLTLDAMPSVVREAIEQERLNITRRA